MTDAPERIWAGRWPHGGRAWRDAPAVHIKTAYIRADLVEALEAENQRLREALRDFDEADWFWRDLDPDDSGDSAHEAISMLPDFMVSCVCSSFSGPTRYVFRAPVLDSGSDDTEVLHFATESEAIAAARARAALRSTETSHD